MSSVLGATGVRPFSASGYEILDEGLSRTGEVVIWSIDSLTPRVGDLFTLESGGQTHEVAVRALATFKGGWSATCKVAA